MIDMKQGFQIIDTLQKNQNITLKNLHFLLETQDKEVLEYLKQRARQTAVAIYDNHVYIRGLIEFTNIL